MLCLCQASQQARKRLLKAAPSTGVRATRQLTTPHWPFQRRVAVRAILVQETAESCPIWRAGGQADGWMHARMHGWRLRYAHTVFALRCHSDTAAHFTRSFLFPSLLISLSSIDVLSIQKRLVLLLSLSQFSRSLPAACFILVPNSLDSIAQRTQSSLLSF